MLEKINILGDTMSFMGSLLTEKKAPITIMEPTVTPLTNLSEMVRQSQYNTELVDLGLPSGLLWCKCNIGANTETEGGKYFMWGDIEGRYSHELHVKPCLWERAPFNGCLKTYNEPFFNEHKSEWLNGDVLKPEYDAATQLLGSNFRMPTRKEYEELIDNCKWEWTEINGISGSKYTSKINGNYIFFPAVGCGYGITSLCVGKASCYWSSSLDNNLMNYAFYHHSDSDGRDRDNFNRWVGQSVRGVCLKC